MTRQSVESERSKHQSVAIRHEPPYPIAARRAAVTGVIGVAMIAGCNLVIGLQEPHFIVEPDDAANPAEAATVSRDGATVPRDVETISPDVSADSGNTLHSPYADAVLADSPIAYWRLDEPASTDIAVDSSGKGNNGKYDSSCKRSVQGAIPSDGNRATYFDGVQCAVSIPRGTALQFAGNKPFTFEAWVKPEDTKNNVIFSTEIAVPSRTGNTMGVMEGQLGFERLSGGYGFWCRTGTIPLNAFSHVVAVYDGSQRLLYINGAFAQSFSDEGTEIETEALPMIGAIDLGSRGLYFKGVIDEVAVYGSALSPARISAHYLSAVR